MAVTFYHHVGAGISKLTYLGILYCYLTVTWAGRNRKGITFLERELVMLLITLGTGLFHLA